MPYAMRMHHFIQTQGAPFYTESTIYAEIEARVERSCLVFCNKRWHQVLLRKCVHSIRVSIFVAHYK